MDLRPTFSPRQLRQVRDELGLSQEGLARSIDVSLAAVEHWEAGRREPGGKYVAQIARLAGKTMESFYVHTGGEVTQATEAGPEVTENAKSAPPLNPVTGRS